MAPGPTGTKHNSPVNQRGGTLSRQPAGPPGTVGKAQPSVSIEKKIGALHAKWEKLGKAVEWWQRTIAYYDPQTRQEQAIKDLAELPFVLVQLLGVQLSAIPLAEIWKAEIEFLITFLIDAANAETIANRAARDWQRALEISRALAPRVRELAGRTKLPDEDSKVKIWNNFTKYNYQPGSFYFDFGSGGGFTITSHEHIRRIREECGGWILSRSEELLTTQLSATSQLLMLTQLTESAVSSLEKLRTSKSVVKQIVGNLSATQLDLEADVAVGGAPGALGQDARTHLLAFSQTMVTPWVEAADAVAKGLTVRV